MANEAGLRPFGAGIWIDHTPVRIVGTQLTAAMSVVRSSDGGLLVHSPLPLTAARRAAVDALGTVTQLYAPNLYHHSWLGPWADAYPDARVHGPSALRKKRPELRIDRVHGDGAFVDGIDELRIDGCRLAETALYVHSAQTLIVADLVHNIGRPAGAWTRAYTKAMGFYDRVALSRVLRWTAFSDRAAARTSVDELLARPFERLVVGHGEPLTRDARDALASAYTFLR
jgi:hypothetical protein